jgi:hypothetical protein
MTRADLIAFGVILAPLGYLVVLFALVSLLAVVEKWWFK